MFLSFHQHPTCLLHYVALSSQQPQETGIITHPLLFMQATASPPGGDLGSLLYP